MSVNPRKLWEAKPHTIAKIVLLRSYLYVWFSIIGRSFPRKDLWYIDGFAGPGEYSNYPSGSPVAAIQAAKSALVETGGSWKGGSIRCWFVEDTKAIFQNLESVLNALERHPKVSFQTFSGTFVDGLNELRRHQPNPFQRGDPLFAFIDPFGPKGLSFSAVRELLSLSTCEVLINLDSDGIARILLAGKAANHKELLDGVFGDSQWESELADVTGLSTKSLNKVVEAYIRRLRKLSGVKYVFSFEMRSSVASINYHLIFATRNRLGLEKMKEQMKQIDKSGGYSFCDSTSGQETLFKFDDPSQYAPKLGKYFQGKTVRYSEVDEFALNESPFVNPKAMLRHLESRKSITVMGRNGRSGTYPDAQHSSILIEFHEN